MNPHTDASQPTATMSQTTHAPRDLVEAVSGHTAGGDPFLTVTLRGFHPWLVPDTATTRAALLAVGITVRKPENLPVGNATGDAVPDLSRWAQMAVALYDDDGIGWLVIVMKAGGVMRIADNAQNRLFVLQRHVSLVEANMSEGAVTRSLLPNG